MPSENSRTDSGNLERTVIFIRSESIGRGDDELGSSLMLNFMHHVSETDPPPGIMILMNAGVKLVADDSEILDSLRQLENRGVTILVCGTCLDFFRIRDRQSVGRASNMPEIIRTLLAASRVITI